jgi:hypothetical protein
MYTMDGDGYKSKNPWYGASPSHQMYIADQATLRSFAIYMVAQSRVAVKRKRVNP